MSVTLIPDKVRHPQAVSPVIKTPFTYVCERPLQFRRRNILLHKSFNPHPEQSYYYHFRVVGRQYHYNCAGMMVAQP